MFAPSNANGKRTHLHYVLKTRPLSSGDCNSSAMRSHFADARDLLRVFQAGQRQAGGSRARAQPSQARAKNAVYHARRIVCTRVCAYVHACMYIMCVCAREITRAAAELNRYANRVHACSPLRVVTHILSGFVCAYHYSYRIIQKYAYYYYAYIINACCCSL